MKSMNNMYSLLKEIYQIKTQNGNNKKMIYYL